MADEFVQTQRTKVGAQALYSTLRAAWRKQLGTEPSRASLLVLLAQWSFETADGLRCNNFNLGGIKWTRGCGRDYTTYQTAEIVDGKGIIEAQRFRAYTDLTSAAEDYLLVVRRDFADAWPFVEAADVRGYARALKNRPRPYYTAIESVYETGLVARMAQIDHQVGPDTSPDAIADVTPLPVTGALADAATDVVGTEQPTPPDDLPPAT